MHTRIFQKTVTQYAVRIVIMVSHLGAMVADDMMVTGYRSYHCNKEATMTCNILDKAHIHPAIRQAITNKISEIIREVSAVMASSTFVIVSMAQNPPSPARSTNCLIRLVRHTSTSMAAILASGGVAIATKCGRLAHLPDGVCQRHAGGRNSRTGTVKR